MLTRGGDIRGDDELSGVITLIEGERHNAGDGMGEAEEVGSVVGWIRPLSWCASVE
jgi:hypothetical protein